MSKKINFIFLLSLLIWLLSQAFILKPNLFFVSLTLSSLAIIIVTRKIVCQRQAPFWPLLAVNPLLTYLSAAFYCAILINQILIQFILVFVAILIFSYFKNIYYYYSFGAPEREAKLRKLVIVSSFLSFFAAAATLYALPIFLNFSFWLIYVWLTAIGVIFFLQLSILSIRKNHHWLMKSVNIIILSELSGVLLLLPLNYNVRALLLAIFFYLLMLLDNWHYEDRLTFKQIKWPLLIALIIVFIILFFARWR